MTRAQVRRTPERQVHPGVSARARWGPLGPEVERMLAEDAAARQRATERTGRELVSWLIGRWQR